MRVKKNIPPLQYLTVMYDIVVRPFWSFSDTHSVMNVVSYFYRPTLLTLLYIFFLLPPNTRARAIGPI